MSDVVFDFATVRDFAEIEQEFLARVRRMVWCSAATVDTQDRPRSRILHPLWEGATGWIGTHRNSAKSKHLARKPLLSLAYITEPRTPVYIDCTVEWITDLTEKRRVWDLFKNTPEPVGYDPSLDFKTYDNPTYGLLKLTLWRVEVYTLGVGTKTWKAQQTAKA
jgi:uncharacterized pyridoxamine 5'-phosphate oxidase family protein